MVPEVPEVLEVPEDPKVSEFPEVQFDIFISNLKKIEI